MLVQQSLLKPLFRYHPVATIAIVIGSLVVIITSAIMMIIVVVTSVSIVVTMIAINDSKTLGHWLGSRCRRSNIGGKSFTGFVCFRSGAWELVAWLENASLQQELNQPILLLQIISKKFPLQPPATFGPTTLSISASMCVQWSQNPRRPRTNSHASVGCCDS